ncbi:talin-1-like isoform X4 [Convolutriloba macropyga]|uniref:talin-1-like isoform X4 n=1 Tax=Convolutriloba macropyga TaxID=536237 RepID=UPI003F51D30F
MGPDQGNIELEVTYFRSNQDFLENMDLPMEMKLNFSLPRNTTLGDVRLKISRTAKQRHDEVERFGLFVPKQQLDLSDMAPNRNEGIWYDSSRDIEKLGSLVSGPGVTTLQLEYRSLYRTITINLPSGHRKMDVRETQKVGEIVRMVCQKEGIVGDIVDEYSIMVEPETPAEGQTMTLGGTRTWGNMTTMGKSKTMGMGTLSPDFKGSPGGEKTPATIGRNAKKMEKLKKKLRTDDEILWLDHSKSLHDHTNIDLDTVKLTFRRKFFFSDVNVTETDPVQLSLLYKQTSEAITKSAHPVSEETAIELAALAAISENGLIDAPVKEMSAQYKSYLPEEYRKVSKIDKRIDQARIKYIDQIKAEIESNDASAANNQNDLEFIEKAERKATKKYIDKCRALKTFGYRFYLVKEKMKNKNKLVPVLLGVNKDGIVTADAVNKEVTKMFYLHQIKQHFCTDASFHITLPGYQAEDYVVQTNEGKNIVKLLEGYIEIHLQKMRKRERLNNQNTENTIQEENIDSKQAQTFQIGGDVSQRGGNLGGYHGMAVPQVMRQGDAKQVTINRIDWGAKKAKVGTYFDEGVRRVAEVEDDLLESQRGYILSNEAADMNAAVAGLRANEYLSNITHLAVQMLVPENENQLQYSLSTVSKDLKAFSEAIKILASQLEDPEKRNLIDSAVELTNAFGDLLRLAHPGSEATAEQLHDAAQKIAEKAQNIVDQLDQFIVIGSGAANSQILLNLVQEVLSKVEALTNKAGEIAFTSGVEQKAQEQIMLSKGSLEGASLNLKSVAHLLAPVAANDPMSKQQLSRATDNVVKKVRDVVNNVQPNCPDTEAVNEVLSMSHQLHNDLGNLGSFIHTLGTGDQSNASSQFSQINALMQKVRYNMDKQDQEATINALKHLMVSCNYLIKQAKEDAGNPNVDEDQKHSIIAAAHGLTGAMRTLLADIKAYQTDGGKPLSREEVLAILKSVQDQVNELCKEDAMRDVFMKLELLVWQSCVVGNKTQEAALMTCSAGDSLINHNETRHKLSFNSQRVNQFMVPLLEALKEQRQTNSRDTQCRLINTAREYLEPGNDLVKACQLALAYMQPTALQGADDSASLQGQPGSTMSQHLNQCASLFSTSLQALQDILLLAADLCGNYELDNAIIVADSCVRLLKESAQLAAENALRPPEGTQMADKQKLAVDANQACIDINESFAELLKNLANGNARGCNQSARAIANRFEQFAEDCKRVASLLDSRDEQIQLIQSAQNLIFEGKLTLQEIQHVMERGEGYLNNVQKASFLKKTKVADLDGAIQMFVSTLPGQKEFQTCSDIVNECNQSIQKAPTYDGPFNTQFSSINELQANLHSVSGAFSDEINLLVHSCTKNPEGLPSSALQTAKNLHQFVLISLDFYLSSKDRNALEPQKMLQVLDKLVYSSSILLDTSRQVFATSGSSNSADTSAQLHPKLSASARAVVSGINAMLELVLQSSPGLKHCDSAIRNIELVSKMLQNPNRPINNRSYFENFENVMEQSRALGSNMSQLTFDANRGDLDQFGERVEATCQSICQLMEGAAQIAYLVGASDERSKPGKKALVDREHLEALRDEYLGAWKKVFSPDLDRQELTPAASALAQATRDVIGFCRVSSTACSANPPISDKFKAFGHKTAMATKSALDGLKSGEAPNPEVYNQLEAAFTDLLRLSASKELAGEPAILSEEGKMLQQPIIRAGEYVKVASLQWVNSAKGLCESGSGENWPQVSDGAVQVTNAVESLLAEVRANAPWQKHCEATLSLLEQMFANFINEVRERRATGESGKPSSQNYQFANIETVSASLLDVIDQLNSLSHEMRTAILDRQVERIGHISQSMVQNYMVQLLHHSQQFLICISGESDRMNFEQHLQTVYEAAKEEIENAKAYSVSPQLDKKQSFDQSATDFEQSLVELRECVDSLASRFGSIGTVLAELEETLASPELAQLTQADSGKTIKQIIDELQSYVDALNRTSSDMTPASDTQVDRLGPLCKDLVDQYLAILKRSNAVENMRGVRRTQKGEQDEVVKALQNEIGMLGIHCKERVVLSEVILKSPYDRHAKQEFHSNSGVIRDTVKNINQLIEQLWTGVKSCDDAIRTITAIIGDPSFAILFTIGGVTTPAVNTDTEDTSAGIGEHTPMIKKAIEALKKDTYAMLQSATDRQDMLAVTAPATAKSLDALKGCVTDGVKSLGEDQGPTKDVLLGAVREVANSLSGVIEATRNHCVDGTQPLTKHVKIPSEKWATACIQLQNMVSDIEDKHDLVSESLQSCIAVLEEELMKLAVNKNLIKSHPSALNDSTDTIHILTSGIVSSFRTRNLNQLLDYATRGRETLIDMLKVSRSLAFSLPSDSAVQKDLFTAAKGCTSSFMQLLSFLKIEVENGFAGGKASHTSMTEITRNLSKDVTRLQNIGMSLEKEEQNVKAVESLGNTAAQLSKEVDKFTKLRPSKPLVVPSAASGAAGGEGSAKEKENAEIEKQIEFSDAVWGSSTDIARAVLVLIRAATEAQAAIDATYKGYAHAPDCSGHKDSCFCDSIFSIKRATGTTSSNTLNNMRKTEMYHKDAQWSEGLVSAAKEVEIATHHLVRGANDVMQGHGQEETLISASKQVVAKTTALVYACKSKTQLGDTVETNLNRASDNVKKAVAALVKDASEFIEQKPVQGIELPAGKVQAMAAEIKLREALDKRRRELEAAREAFEKYQRARYDRDAMTAAA